MSSTDNPSLSRKLIEHKDYNYFTEIYCLTTGGSEAWNNTREYLVMGSCRSEVEHWVTGRQLLQEPEAMAEQCLAASRPAIDCHLLRNFLAFLTPLGMAAAVLSVTSKVTGKRSKLI